MRVFTFDLTGHERSVLEALTALGFEFEPSRTVIELESSADGPPHARPLRLRLPTVRTGGTWRNASGEVVAIAELHEGINVVDRPDIDCAPSTIDIHEIPGQGEWTLLAIDALRRIGAVETDDDPLADDAATAGVDPVGFGATATVGLDPQMAAIDGLRLVLGNLAAVITANWQGTIDDTDPEFLHDLRIAMRRTRTLLGEAKAVLPKAVLEPARVGFAWLAEFTGQPRDLDVYLLEWAHYTGPLGTDVVQSLEPVRALLERRRADSHVELERALRSERAAELMNGWRVWLAQPLGSDELPRRAVRPLGRMVAKRIVRAHRTLIARGRVIGPDTPAEQIHDLRKDAKKLRYLLECYGSLLPAKARKPYVKRLKALQDNLGEHQDAEVHVSLLRGIANEFAEAGASRDTMAAIGLLTERLDGQRLAARAEFADRFADYDTPATQAALDAVLEGITH